MRYGSIGWSVGAVLGYQVAAGSSKRVVGLIGDGSFQLTVQVGPGRATSGSGGGPVPRGELSIGGIELRPPLTEVQGPLRVCG